MHITRTVFREDHEQFRDTVKYFLDRECVPHMAAWNQAGAIDPASGAKRPARA
jgi:acyl-CoA dehydrogenase